MVIRNLTIALLFVALAFMNIGGCGGSSGGGGGNGSDCADIAGIILLLFTETSNDCGEPLQPPELVTTDCSQSGCSVNCTFTNEEDQSIDTSGSISEDGVVNLFGEASFEDPGPPPTIADVELSCLVQVTDDGDFIDGNCTQSIEEFELAAATQSEEEIDLKGAPTFSCIHQFDVDEAPPPPPVGSCVGLCGELGPGDCFCDDQCLEFDDCCSDFVEVCGEPADTLTWNVEGEASATGFPAFDVDCMTVFTLPLEGGTASTTCGPSDVTFTVGPAPGGTFEVSGLGNGTFGGVVCAGGAGGSSPITEGPTSFSAGEVIEGTVTCDGIEIDLTGSYSAEADK